MSTNTASLSTSKPIQTRSKGIFRRALFSTLDKLTEGSLTVREGSSTHHFGQAAVTAELQAEVHVHDSAFYRYAALNGGLGVGEAYIEGFWDCDDLTKLIQLFVRNRHVLDAIGGRLGKISRPLLKWFHYKNRNTRSGSKKNIAAHYDLGNDLFELFLDQNLMYSAAAYRSCDQTLEQASDHKLDRLCQKLDLQPTDHLLEIGTGWGGMAIFAAQHYGCHVTTTTISQQQFEMARSRVQAAGLEGQITLLLKDYRELTGQYDKLVSIEMVEAVGHQFLDTYFAKCASLLKPEGMMAIQAITIEDQRYQSALKTVDFIKRFVFPGSFIPAVSVLANSLARSSDLRLFHLEDIGLSYARTLNEWRRRFFENIHHVRTQGYSEEFIRLWEYYLCYCEGGFLERQISDVQMLLTKPRCQRAELLPELTS